MLVVDDDVLLALNVNPSRAFPTLEVGGIILPDAFNNRKHVQLVTNARGGRLSLPAHEVTKRSCSSDIARDVQSNFVYILCWRFFLVDLAQW